MVWELSLADGVRIASGALLFLFGVGLLVTRRRMRTARWLGVTLAGVGLMGMTTNGPLPDDSLYAWSAFSGAVGMTTAIVGVLMLLHESEGRRARYAFAGGAALLAVSAILLEAPAIAAGGTQLDPERTSHGLRGALYAWSMLAFPFVACGLLAWWGVLAARNTDASKARARAILALGLMLYPFAFLAIEGGGHGFGRPPASTAGGLVLLAVCAIPLVSCVLVWSRGPHGRAVVLSLPLIAAALVVADVTSSVDIGANGIARIVGLGIVAYAIFRLDALDAGFGARTMRRGAAASGFLVVLLVVAQVAQNFLSAQYGLITGGVVAGALLVAARPIERALEGRPETRAPQTDGAKEDAFRQAVRMALRDRVITREEELHLHRVAQHMNIPTGRAHELLIEVERESSGRA